MKLKFDQITYEAYKNDDRYVVNTFPESFSVYADRPNIKKPYVLLYATGHLKETIEYPTFDELNGLDSLKKLSSWNILNKIFKEFNIDPEKYYW